MAFNFDTKNIFNKYVQNILEAAVKPVVVDEFGNETPDDGTTPAPSPEAIRASRERLKQQNANELRQQANDMKAQGIPSGSTVYSTPEGSPSSVSTTPVPDEWDEVDPDSVLPDFDLNYKTPQPQSKQTSTINSQPTSSSYTNTTTTNQSTRTGGGSTTVFADRDEAGQQAAAERAKQKREAGSQGASRIVGGNPGSPAANDQFFQQAVQEFDNRPGNVNKFNQLTGQQKMDVSRNLRQRADQLRSQGGSQSKIIGRADPSTAQGQAAIAQNQQNIAAKQQQQATDRAAQEQKSKQSLQNLQTPGAKTFNATPTPPKPTSTVSGNTGMTTAQQKSIDDGKFFDQMAANAGVGSSASKLSQQDLGKFDSLNKQMDDLINQLNSFSANKQ